MMCYVTKMGNRYWSPYHLEARNVNDDWFCRKCGNRLVPLEPLDPFDDPDWVTSYLIMEWP